jgi:hypothetical protein
MNIKPEFDALFAKYLEIDTPFRPLLERGTAVAITEREKNILFVGINPSYKDGESHEYEVHDAVKGYPPYFRVFHTLANDAKYGDSWTYMDLFYHRETNQNEVNELLNSDIGLKFLCEQLILSQGVLEYAKPKLIVVCNARASDFFGVNKSEQGTNVWMGYEFEFDETCGLHRISGLQPERINKELTHTRLENVPVCFTSTLKYMDKFSRNRLAWQLRLALNEVCLISEWSRLRQAGKFAPAKDLTRPRCLVAQKLE